MNAVPTEKQGQAGGVTMTARLVGSAVGIAVCGTVLTPTGRFQAVFLDTRAILLAVLVFGCFAAGRPETR